MAVRAPLMAELEVSPKRLGEVARKRWHEKFEQWGEYFEGGGQVRSSLACAEQRSIPLGDDVSDPRFARFYEPTRVVVLQGEAEDTNKLIRGLADRLQSAVVATYRWSGTLRSRADRLGIHPDTLRNRVALAMFECEQAWQRGRTHAYKTKLI